jgi:signal transduction histidine kinase
MSLRVRIVLVTAVAVTALITVVDVLTIRAVRTEFEETAREMSQMRAVEVARLARDGSLTGRLPALDEGETVVQVVGAGGVVSRTANVSTDPMLRLPRRAPGSLHTLMVEELAGVVGGPYQVTSIETTSPGGQLTVLVAVTTEDMEEVVEVAIATGSLGLLLLVVPLSLLLWVAAGRTLAPVEAIRERADVITAENLTERVPEPPRLDEIGRLARTINAMLGRLDRSSTEQKRFLANAAHELRSPIASLRAQLETIRAGDLTGGSADETVQVTGLMTDTLRMQTLVDQLLLLARSDAGVTGQVRVTVDLDDVVTAVVAAQGQENRRPEVAVDTQAVVPVQVSGDPLLLEQVVRNLLDNAVTHASGSVRVSLEQAAGEAVLTVDDDGPGIPEEFRREVFGRFARLDAGRARANGGVGLGLAIVSEVVRAHRGSVVVLDAPGGGARLQVRLPLAVQPPPDPHPPGDQV